MAAFGAWSALAGAVGIWGTAGCGTTEMGAPAGTGGAGGAGNRGGAGTGSVGSGAGTSGNGGPGTGGMMSGAGSGGAPVIGSSGCPLFSTDDAWNRDVSAAPVDAAWTTKLAALVGDIKLHPDFGAGYGIPFNVVPATQPNVPIAYDQYGDESDPGPFPLPEVGAARIEGSDDPRACDGDCHLLVIQQTTCLLFEGWACRYDNGAGWICGSGARWDLTKNSYGQRPKGWTSADAAGLSVYAGLARYEEVAAGAITHAIRFTTKCSAPSYIAPATHAAGNCSTNANAPPMGLRVRMKAAYDGTSLSAEAQVFVRAFKKYGMILADNGSNFYFQSEDNAAWPDRMIEDLKKIPASAFEVVTAP